MSTFYRPPANCQVPNLGEKWETIFGQTAEGFFVEVGAYDGENFSNTSCLADVGWAGLYIEPIKEFAEKCRARHSRNPRVSVLGCAVSDTAGVTPIFIGDTLTTLVEEQVDDYEKIDWARGLHRGESRDVRTALLDTILEEHGVPTDFDVLVIDVEGAEEKVVRGFDVKRWRPKVILIELEDEHPDFKDNPRIVGSVAGIREKFAAAGYSIFFKDHINSLYVRKDVADALADHSPERFDEAPAVLPIAAPNPARELLKRKFIQEFRDAHYVRHNQRRQEHLASLGLAIEGRSVLELGAGIGDHTTFFIDRNCSICVSDGRPELYEILKERYFWMRTELLDLEEPDPNFRDVYEIVYAYGLLYHLSDPAGALATMAKWCGSTLLLETAVTHEDGLTENLVFENKELGSQAVSGTGCRPSREWVFDQLKLFFPYVYLTVTQPWHPEFPLDWDNIPADAAMTRAVFVSSRTPLDLPTLSTELMRRQSRH
jgi:FkbM family methyltransferase